MKDNNNDNNVGDNYVENMSHVTCDTMPDFILL